MPSSEYYWRQADLCLRLSLLSEDEVSAKLLIIKAMEMMAQAYAAASALPARRDPPEGGDA